MKGLRPLLRLDDKVAAEGRRLQNLGAGTSAWGGLTLLAAAAILHGAMLMLPAVHVKATLPAASPAPGFPRVWRFDPPPPPAPKPAPAATSQSPAAGKDRELALPSVTDAKPPSAPPPSRSLSLSLEPVPEPSPNVTMRMISSKVEAYIP